MSNKNVEKVLYSAFSNITTDMFEDIKKGCQKNKGIKVEVTPNPVKPMITRKMLARVACFVAIFGVVLTAIVLMLTKTPVSYVCIDVNPSFTVSLNRFDKVICVNGNNKEAQEILAENTISKSDINKTADEIISIVKEKEYLTEKDNSILLSVISDDREKRDTLCDNLSNSILSQKDSKKYNLISQALRTDEALNRKAKKYDTSVGKVNYVSQISSKTKYSFDNLISLKINDLANIVSENGLKLGEIKANGKPSENSLIGKENAKTIVFSDLKMKESSADFTSTELGATAKTLVYIITVNVDKKNSKYDIDAHSGEIVEKISFDGTVYINEKYLPKMTDDSLPKEERNYITFTESREEPTATEGSDNIGNKTESGTQTPTAEIETNIKEELQIFTEEPTDKTETPTKEDIPVPISKDPSELFTSDSSLYKQISLYGTQKICSGESIPYISRYEYIKTYEHPHNSREEGGFVALICNEEQCSEFYRRCYGMLGYNKEAGKEFFDQKVLVVFKYIRNNDKALFLDDILVQDDLLFVRTRIERTATTPIKSYDVLAIYEINKSEIKNISRFSVDIES